METIAAEKFFTEWEKTKIADTIRRVESVTIGEVAVMVVGESARYPDAELLPAAVLVLLLSLVTRGLWLLPFWWEPALMLAVYPLLILAAGRFPALRRAFISPRRMEAKVRQRAEEAFLERGLDKTAKHTGVLFFLSLLERRVRVMADSGIYEKIRQENLDGYALSVSRGILEGRAGEALSGAIVEVGRKLERHFPAVPGDINELPDEIITG